MARADLLVTLVRAGARGDQQLFRKTVEAMVAEERGKQHHVLADRLSENLRANGVAAPSKGLAGGEHLVHQVLPERSLARLILPEQVAQACSELIEEQHRRDLLRAHNLEPRHRVLLVGPPGNGKTSLAEALAHALMVPLFVARYEAIIGSYLGETATRLGRLFDMVRRHHCVLFLDEFDTLGKERGDLHETGEIKRVVSSLLLQVDALPSHTVVVTATNHPELLDRAVWRRFQLRLELPAPTREQRSEWFRRAVQERSWGLGLAPRTLANKLDGLSFAELEDFTLDIQRRLVLAGPEADARAIVGARVKQWQARIDR